MSPGAHSEALGEPGVVAIAEGQRSIAIGGDAVGSLLVTGDNNTFFIGRYERLADAYLRPTALFQDLRLQSFTGREWLTGQLDDFLTSARCGYLILEAEAGLGKTTFLAWLARTRGYPHHFVRLMPDPDDAAVALKNLASQLITAWHLADYAVGGVLPPTAGRPDFLAELLVAVAEKRDKLRPGEPVVLVVDGLNETTPASGQNVLGLPSDLPPGIFVLVSQRPVPVALRVNCPRRVVAIDAHSSDNVSDAQRFLAKVAVGPELAPKLAAYGVVVAEFVATMLAKSQGSWIYMHYVLAEVASGGRSPQDLKDLPVGLWQYYAQFWRERQESAGERWYTIDSALLGTLAAALEPLPAMTLATLSGEGITEPMAGTILDDAWRPFLQVQDGPEAPMFSIFHDSLREFLTGRFDVRLLTSAERAFANRLGRATRQAHSRIASSYLDRWGGSTSGLRALSGSSLPERDGYGVRHLIEHLDQADRMDDLHGILALSTPGRAGDVNLWHEVHRRHGSIGGYRRDLEIALAATQRRRGPSRATLQLRYALMLASLNSQAGASPPTLWPTLIRHGRLSAEEALNYARQIPAAQERAEALAGLMPVAGDIRSIVEREALSAIWATSDGYWRVGEIWRINAVISEELRPDLVAIAESIADPYYKIVVSRLLGLANATPVVFTPSGSEHEPDVDSPSGLAGSGAFVEAYVQRRGFASSLLRQADALAGLTPMSSDESYWLAHLLIAESSIAEAVSVGDRIGDLDDQLAAWSALDDASMATADVSTLPPAAAAAVLLCRDDDDAIAHLGRLASTVVLAVFDACVPRIANRHPDRLRRLVSVLEPLQERVEVLVALADHAPAASAEALSAAALKHVVSMPPNGVVTSSACRLARLVHPSLLPSILALVPALLDRDLKHQLLCAVGLRRCADGETDVALELAAELDGDAHDTLLRAIAMRFMDQGMRARAVALAGRIQTAPWRCDLLAATAELDGFDAVLATLDEPSAASVLSRAATVAEPPLRPGLLARAERAVAALGDPGLRSATALALVQAQLEAPDLGSALRTAERIPVARLRAQALALIVTRGDVEVIGRVAGAVAAIDEPYARFLLRLELVRASLRLGLPDLSAHFEETIAESVTLARGQLLRSFAILAPAVSQLDGRPGLLPDLANITEWWP